jgi:hypothetical protein
MFPSLFGVARQQPAKVREAVQITQDLGIELRVCRHQRCHAPFRAPTEFKSGSFAHDLIGCATDDE